MMARRQIAAAIDGARNALWAAICLAILSAIHLAAAQTPPTTALLEPQIRAQVMAGSVDAARSKVMAALGQAQTPTARAELWLGYSDALAARARISTGSEAATLRTEAAEHYKTGLADLAGRARLLAHNNYGSLLLQQGQTELALAQFEEGIAEAERQKDAKALARLELNAGALFERSERYDEALSRYRRAFESDAALTSAAQSGLRVALARPEVPSAADATALLLGQVVKEGALQLAATTLPAALAQPAWRERPAFTGIVEAWMNYLVASKTGPALYKEKWQELAATLAQGAREDAAMRVRLCQAAFGGELPVLYFTEAAKQRLAPWLGSRPEPTEAAQLPSRLLEAAGAGFVAAHRPADAFARYVAAWAIDPENVSAALFAANLLLVDADRIDPDRKQLNTFIKALFESKQSAYLRNDWPNILRLHTILGTIFVRQEHWGSEDEKRSAVFQWDRAARALGELRKTQPAAAARYVPGVFEKLGVAYTGARAFGKAWGAYDKAIAGAIELGDFAAARRVMDAADSLRYQPTEAERQRFRQYRSQIQP